MAAFVEQAEVAVAVAVAATPGADVVCVVIDVYRMLSTVSVLCFVLWVLIGFWLNFVVKCRWAMLLFTNTTLYCINRQNLFIGFTRMLVRLVVWKRMGP